MWLAEGALGQASRGPQIQRGLAVYCLSPAIPGGRGLAQHRNVGVQPALLLHQPWNVCS